MRKITAAQATQVASQSEDAYSFDRYAHGEWAKAARLLASRGLNAAEVEWFLRSKHMRWAADESGGSDGAVTAEVLPAYLKRQKPGFMIQLRLEVERGS